MIVKVQSRRSCRDAFGGTRKVDITGNLRPKLHAVLMIGSSCLPTTSARNDVEEIDTQSER